jgi:UDP-glucose 4-epimerase
LVTGGAGAIGSNLSRSLANNGAQVTILDDLSSTEIWNAPRDPHIQLVIGDILDGDVRRKALKANPEIIFHLAAFFANQNSVDNKERDLMVNGMGTLRLLEDLRSRTISRFVFASSGCSVYGSEAPLPLREEFMSLHLSTPYQITKMLGELYSNFFFEHYQLPVVKARLFNSYGPGEIPGRYRNVIPNFIYWAMKGTPLPITGSGEETRDFTFVDDIVDGLLRCGYVRDAIGSEFNLASAEEVKIIDLARQVNALTRNQAGVEFVERRPWDTKSRLLASIDRARAVLGFEPHMRFADGLAATVAWFRMNWDKISASPRFFESRNLSAVFEGK